MSKSGSIVIDLFFAKIFGTNFSAHLFFLIDAALNERLRFFDDHRLHDASLGHFKPAIIGWILNFHV